jgi:hypothetical protein
MIISKSTLLLDSLLMYYEQKINMDSFVEILQDKSLVSLRMIDWFITKYAKINNIHYEIQGKNFSIYDNYKSQLKAYSKRQIDPFCRRNRLCVIKHGHEIVTTIGQLNFFRWAIEHHVIKYIYDHFDVIELAMKSENKTLSRKKRKICEPKRSFSRTSVSTILSFD